VRQATLGIKSIKYKILPQDCAVGAWEPEVSNASARSIRRMMVGGSHAFAEKHQVIRKGRSLRVEFELPAR